MECYIALLGRLRGLRGVGRTTGGIGAGLLRWGRRDQLRFGMLKASLEISNLILERLLVSVGAGHRGIVGLSRGGGRGEEGFWLAVLLLARTATG